MPDDKIRQVYRSDWVTHSSGDRVASFRVGQSPEGFHEKLMTFGVHQSMDYGTWSPPFEKKEQAMTAGQEKLKTWLKGEPGADGSSSSTPSTKDMELSQEERQKAVRAASGVKNANQGKALPAKPAGTDDIRTPPATPGYQPNYGQTVTKVEPPSTPEK